MAGILSLRGFRVGNRESLKSGYFEPWRSLFYSFEWFRFERSRCNILKFFTFRNEILRCWIFDELERTSDAVVWNVGILNLHIWSLFSESKYSKFQRFEWMEIRQVATRFNSFDFDQRFWTFLWLSPYAITCKELLLLVCYSRPIKFTFPEKRSNKTLRWNEIFQFIVAISPISTNCKAPLLI